MSGPGTAYTNLQDIIPSSSKTGTLLNPAIGDYTVPSDVTGWSGMDLSTAVHKCEQLGTFCQGLVVGNTFTGSKEELDDIWKRGTDTVNKWSVKQSLYVFKQGAGDSADCPDSLKNELHKTSENCSKYEGKTYHNYIKNKPSDSEYINLSDLPGMEDKTGTLLNPAIKDYTVPSDVTGWSGMDLATAKSKCDNLGSFCQGLVVGNTFTGSKKELDDIWKRGTDTVNKWSVKQSLYVFKQGAGDSADCPDSLKNELYKTDENCSKYEGKTYHNYIKRGAAIPGTGAGDSKGLWCLASITKIPKVVNGTIEYVEIKDLKVGDIIQTTRGNMPISDIMKTDTRGYVHDNYVKVEKGALGENFPSEDLYVTHEHSFSLGYYKNSLLNRNIHDNEQDDMVYLHITADQLADKLPGITRVSKEFESAINLVFDEHTSINVYGLDIVTHHPKGNPYILSEEKYQNKSKFNSKVQKPLFASYDMLVNAKPEHMEMKDFLRGCITANLENKLNLENVNNISFTPQKTMLTEDLRQKINA